MHACQHASMQMFSLSLILSSVRCIYNDPSICSLSFGVYPMFVPTSKYLHYFLEGRLHVAMAISIRDCICTTHTGNPKCSILKLYCAKCMRSNAPCRFYVMRTLSLYIYAKWYLICRAAVACFESLPNG